MRCPHCGQEHPDQSLSCPVTGNRIAAFECPNCGQVVMAGSESCPYCAYDFTTSSAVPAATPAAAARSWLAVLRNRTWLWIPIGMIAALVVISSGVLLFWNGVFTPSSQPVPPAQTLPAGFTPAPADPTETGTAPAASATPSPGPGPAPAPARCQPYPRLALPPGKPGPAPPTRWKWFASRLVVFKSG